MIPTTTFWTSRLVFRQPEARDVEVVLGLYADPTTSLQARGGVVQSVYPFHLLDWNDLKVNECSPMSTSEAEKSIKSGQDDLLNLFICLPKSAEKPTVAGEVIGRLSLSGSMPGFSHDRFSRFSITLVPKYQRAGYGTEAMTWMLDWAFRCANLHRVVGFVFAWNEGAMKLYKKLGFKEEGCWERHAWMEGAWQDVVLLGMIEESWFSARATPAEVVPK